MARTADTGNYTPHQVIDIPRFTDRDDQRNSNLTTGYTTNRLLNQQRGNIRRRNQAFSVRIVQYWNKLPEAIVNASSREIFKTQIDELWQSLFPEVPL